MKKILIAGHCSLDPLGRHSISFLNNFLKDDRNEIYVERSYLLDDYATITKFFSKEIENKRIKYINWNDSNEIFDFLVFTDSISLIPGQNWKQRLFNIKAKIKICYPVFDGSVPPLHWIDVINKFDICLCTSEYCAHNLRRYGVKIDCFCLQCSILIDDLLNLDVNIKKNNKCIRFGTIGASDFRKNIPMLMRSFASSFTKKDNVELFIHSSYGNDITCSDEIMDTYEECSKNCNIILDLKKISHESMIDLWKSFDVYVSPQTTTGYFTTPLEACAVGIPVILSDIHPHLELRKIIPEENNLFYVSHDKLSLAFHWVFDYRPLGCKFDAEENKYSEVLKDVFSRINEINNKKNQKIRKKYASQISSALQYKLYNLLINPEHICITNKISSLDQNVFFMSRRLFDKYKRYWGYKVNYSTINYPEESCYIEETNPVFVALENASVESQKIYLKKCNKIQNNEILTSIWMKKIFDRSRKYGISYMPKFLYKEFSLYCKIKKILNRK